MDPAGRLLRMLSLLQSKPAWPAEELAERMAVTTRTVRRDVTRLRDLGYPVDAGRDGYRLGAGGRLPPLLLDDDEAVAIAVGLRLASLMPSLAGVEVTAVAAAAKLEQVLPDALRERVRGAAGGHRRLAGTGASNRRTRRARHPRPGMPGL